MNKKIILKAFIISGFISIVVFAIEGICAYTIGHMPISFASYGGECTEYLGIGWNILTIYPITSSPQNPTSTIRLNPNIFLFFIFIWALMVLVEMKRHKINNNY